MRGGRRFSLACIASKNVGKNCVAALKVNTYA